MPTVDRLSLFIFTYPIGFLCVMAYTIGMIRTKESETMRTRILLQRKKSDDDEGFISLYKVDNKEYVTWRSNTETPENMYWGHYFGDVVTAVHDFENRGE